MRIVVLGGTGFVGAAITARLAAAHDVVAVGLPGSGRDRPVGRTVSADLLATPDAARDVLRDAEAVVYALAPAAPANGPGRRQAAGERMVEAAGLLAAGAAQAGVRVLVQLSNVSVYGSADGWIGDDTPPAPSYPLGHATLAAERAAAAAMRASGLIRVVRLGPVFAADAARSGASISYLVPGTNWCSPICRDDVAGAVELMLPPGAALPETCVLCDGQPMPAATAAHLVAERRGVPVRPVPLSMAARFGASSFGVLSSSVRLRPAALPAVGWRPGTTLGGEPSGQRVEKPRTQPPHQAQ